MPSSAWADVLLPHRVSVTERQTRERVAIDVATIAYICRDGRGARLVLKNRADLRAIESAGKLLRLIKRQVAAACDAG